MTCIIAIEHATGAVVVADRCVTHSGYAVETKSMPKIWRNGECIIGTSGPVRLANLIRTLDIPIHSCGWDIDFWVVREFIPAAIAHLTDNGYKKETDGKADNNGNMILVVRGRVYAIWSDWSWTRGSSGDYSIGSGSFHAHAALWATRDLIADPLQRAMRAMECAADLASGVRGPFDVLEADRG